ncbi:MAG TPA: 23S rRNA pseudouridine(1911/1915/1917) synthase RluD [Casimicrobiaceae bacterium]|nr:23S rRNA pseudouridine(1911/1915/1917) synthase RluD [Casimicrobiaceae bacterium]
MPPAFAGLRLDQALARLLPQHSRSRLQDWIARGEVLVDGLTREPKYKVHGGESILVSATPSDVALLDQPQALELERAYEDEAILVIDKPPGLVVHPGSGNRDGTLLNALLHHLPQAAALPRAGIVHRLDKDTSGLMVVAKTPKAQTALVRQLQAREVKREYLAVVCGDVARAVTVDAPIGRHPVQRTTMAVVERGKPARTHVSVLERFGDATLVRCTLETGRTHQIRVHLAAIGHPLVGDPAYGGRKKAAGLPAFARQALHAHRLALVHPVSGAMMQWESAPPADLQALIDALRARRVR